MPVFDLSFAGGVYCPISNRMYLAPYGTGDSSYWYYIKSLTNVNISHSLMAGPIFNKF